MMDRMEAMKKAETKMAATNDGNECKESPFVMMMVRVSVVLTVRSTIPQLAFVIVIVCSWFDVLSVVMSVHVLAVKLKVLVSFS